MDEEIKKHISSLLHGVKKSNHCTIAHMAEEIGIPNRTFRNYLYGTVVPPLTFAIKVCNTYSISINSFFIPIIEWDTESKYIEQIGKILNSCSDFQQDKIHTIFDPIFNMMVDSKHSLRNTGFGGRLQSLRVDNDLSLLDISKSCNISKNTLKTLESNQHLPSMISFLLLCRKLCISPEYMLSDYISYKHKCDIHFYDLTPRQLKAIAESLNHFYILQLREPS